jgi:hypothetical protein
MPSVHAFFNQGYCKNKALFSKKQILFMRKNNG